MEDNRTELRTDRLGVLLDQLDFVREMAQARLGGLVSPASLPKGHRWSRERMTSRSPTRSTCGAGAWRLVDPPPR